MPYGVTFRRVRRAALCASFAASLSGAMVLLAPAPRALAQETPPPSPEEIKQKVVEIEKLMKRAEESLARSTSSKQTAAEAARRLEELIEKKMPTFLAGISARIE